MNHINKIIDKIFSTKKNYFITGGAGTGKSLLINTLTRKAEELGKTLLLTASTGIASTHINGGTIHRVLWRIDFYKEIIQSSDYLIIDEISMISKELFGEIMRAIREVNENIQIIAVGDFFQLPPVKKGGKIASFAFESPEWSNANFEMMELEESLRQYDDTEFANNLYLIRTGDRSGISYINQHKATDYMEDAISICDTRWNANVINEKKLDNIASEPKLYHAENGELIKEQNGNFEKKLILKVGCRVMLTINDQHGEYVNGTVGKVIELDDEKITVSVEGREKPIEVYRFSFRELDEKGNEVEVIQFPIVLAYAITVHKSQGLTLDKANIIYDCFWASGQLYTALSRCKSAENIFIGELDKTSEDLRPISKNVSEKDLKVEERVKEYYSNSQKGSHMWI